MEVPTQISTEDGGGGYVLSCTLFKVMDSSASVSEPSQTLQPQLNFCCCGVVVLGFHCLGRRDGGSRVVLRSGGVCVITGPTELHWGLTG